MPTQIYVNLPVRDLPKSVEFFTQLGFTFNPQFTDETSACMIIAPTVFAMLLTHEKFKAFTKKDIIDAEKGVEVILAIDAASKDAVNAMAEKAVAAGGTATMPPQDHGWMFQHGFSDVDGHQWEVLWMDPAGPG